MIAEIYAVKINIAVSDFWIYIKIFIPRDFRVFHRGDFVQYFRDTPRASHGPRQHHEHHGNHHEGHHDLHNISEINHQIPGLKRPGVDHIAAQPHDRDHG